MPVENPESFEEWRENLRKRPDRDVIVFRDMRGGGAKQQAGMAVWQEREDAKQQKIRNEEFEKLKAVKQEREAEHTLWMFWKLADWKERFGMLSFYGLLVSFGYLLSKAELARKAMDFITSVIP